MSAPIELSPLQLDLATAVARLRQISPRVLDREPLTDLDEDILERLITCDLPRLTGHLDPVALALVEEAFADV